LVGYRRYGHNEMDDPDVTQPLMYPKVRNHPTVATIYGDHLLAEKALTNVQVEQVRQRTATTLQQAYDSVKSNDGKVVAHHGEDASFIVAEDVATAVPLQTLRELNLELLNRPEGFTEYAKLKRI